MKKELKTKLMCSPKAEVLKTKLKEENQAQKQRG
jgi:hypothetical protein